MEADFLCSLGSPISDYAASWGALCWDLGGEAGRAQPRSCHWWLTRARWIKTWCDSKPMPSTTRRRTSRVAGDSGCTQRLTVFEPS